MTTSAMGSLAMGTSAMGTSAMGPAGPLAPPEVVVVGGGLAGISAALACAGSGARVTLLEKRSQLGGLTRSFNHRGLWLDNGQHVFLRCCTAYLDFLDRIGSSGDVELQPRLQVTVLRPRTGGPVGLGGGSHQLGSHRLGSHHVDHDEPDLATISRTSWPAPLHLAPSLLGYRLVPRAQRLRLLPAAAALARLDLSDPALDEQTFGSWLAAQHQGKEAVEALWDLICLPTVNLPAAQASLAMATKVFQTGLLKATAAADIGWSRVPLGKLHGERAAAALRKAGADVRTGHEVAAVRYLGTSPAGRSRFVVKAEGAELPADAVVVALPHHLVEDVLPPGALPPGTRPSQLLSSPIVNVHVHFDREVMSWPFVAGLGGLSPWVFDRTGPSGAEAGQYLAVSISAAQDLASAHPSQVTAEVVAALEQLLPRAREAQVLATLVTKEHHATFRATPGSAAHRAPARTRIPGLALAGAWTSTGWPPTMEGAVRSGTAAARAVLVASGQRRSLPSLPREAA